MEGVDSQILKQESIKLSKRNYYHRNADIQKLKALRTYYLKRLQNDELDVTTKEKYESKLAELNSKIGELNGAFQSKPRFSSKPIETQHSLTSLRSYYVKQLKLPNLTEEQKQKILAKISELNKKILQTQLKEKNSEEIIKMKEELENKIQSLDQLKAKYSAKLEEIRVMNV